MSYIPGLLIIALVIATYLANEDDRLQKNRFYLLVTATVVTILIPYIGYTVYALALLSAIRSIPLRRNPGERSFIALVALVVIVKAINTLI